MSEKAFLIDSTKCIGCSACQIACKQWNGLPADLKGPASDLRLSALHWNIVRFDEIKLQKRGLSRQVIWNMFPVRCNHCRDAVCYNVCPEKAIYKVDGWIKIDHSKCIGCGSCQINCPFQAVHVLKKEYPGLEKNKAYKCHGCLDADELPACVQSCPTEALVYDYRLKLIKIAKNRVKQIKDQYPQAALFGLYRQKGLNVFTIVKDKKVINKLVKKNKKRSEGESIKIANVQDVYSLLSRFSFGSKYLKRIVYQLAKKIAG